MRIFLLAESRRMGMHWLDVLLHDSSLTDEQRRVYQDARVIHVDERQMTGMHFSHHDLLVYCSGYGRRGDIEAVEQRIEIAKFTWVPEMTWLGSTGIQRTRAGHGPVPRLNDPVALEAWLAS